MHDTYAMSLHFSLSPLSANLRMYDHVYNAINLSLISPCKCASVTVFSMFLQTPRHTDMTEDHEVFLKILRFAVA